MSMNNQEILLEQVKKAYENHEIIAYYQPQYDALTKKMVSAEALTRWIKADGTIVMPGSYIPVLESTDAILELDWYMLKEVCVMLNEQKKQGIPSVQIAVNFSRKHILEEKFLDKLCALVDEYSITRDLIQVEITESALVDNTELVEAFVNDVRNEGFSVAIDDFGSGLSSLRMVKDIAVDVLKIDKSLLSRNCENEKERIVLESILNFAHRLKLVTVAEGVETQEQLEFLRTCGCKVIQGFLFAKPMPEQEFFKVCMMDIKKDITEDILMIQAPSSATQLLMDAIFVRYPLVIFVNLTRNSYYMMAYENFTAKSCTSTGVFDELIAHGASTMHPDDQEKFRSTFCKENQLKEYANGQKYISCVTRQLGDDGVYRRVETANYFVKSPSVDDVLVISLCHNLD